MHYLLGIDQGTTSTRAIIFNRAGKILSQHQIAHQQYFPNEAWVEHDPEEIWNNTIKCCQEALRKISLTAKNISALGISNQRETTLIWDKKTGKAIYPAIVWQDRRTAEFCKSLAHPETLKKISEKTGLLLDPYFSASKIAWLLQTIPNARSKAERGELVFGTIDTFLLWRFTKGKQHATDITNASRTLLFNIHTQQWDDELLQLFNIPKKILPTVYDNCADFGKTDVTLLDAAIPITGMAGDQQAAAIGQACFEPGIIKSTYGTGCFMLLNTGEKIIASKQKLLTSIIYRINGKINYGIEGSIFNAGTAIQWLRDQLHFFGDARETEKMARNIPSTEGVYFVPAFTGLGAPYWNANARGALLGLTRNTGIAHIVRAALESVCYQTKDLIHALQKDYNAAIHHLRVDGGMTENSWLMQFLADILNIPIQKPRITETSVWGAACLAGLGVGVYESLEELHQLWQIENTFQANMEEKQRVNLYQGWQLAVEKIS